MMTPAPVASAGGAAEYYSSKDNYYFLGNLESQWLGEGAKMLGLEGPVDLDTFTDLLYGRLPDGTVLGKDVQGNHVHRPGHDLTFSAPKSVSLLILAGGDRRLLDAHNESVKETLGIIEQMVTARQTKDGVTSIVPTGKMVAALFTHDTSRNLEPQIHTHAILVNATELEGEWKALSSDTVHGAGFIETIYRNQVSFGKIYRNQMESRTQALGYETEKTGGPHGLWEIKGVPRDLLDHFSSRHAEIIAAVGADASLKSRDVAALDTRQSKRAPAYYDTEKPVVLRPASERETESSIADPELQNTRGQPEITLPEEGRIPGNEQAIPAVAEARPAGISEAMPGHGREPESSIAGPEPEAASERGGIPLAAEGHSPDAKVHEDEKAAAAPVTKPETEQGRERLLNGWRSQCGEMGFDPLAFVAQAHALPQKEEEPVVTPDAMRAVRDAVSLLSDSRTRFTFGDLLLAAHEAGEQAQDISALRPAINEAINSGFLVPLDREKGVFTSQIHLLDELSVQALAGDHLKEGRVVQFSVPDKDPPAHLERVRGLPVAILNAPSAVPRIREIAEDLVTMSRDSGRTVRVLASSAERALTFGKSSQLQDIIVPRSKVLTEHFSLEPHSTLVVEGAERLGLKEMLVLTGEAREKDAQLLFLDSAGRRANGNAVSSLEAAGVGRYALTEPAPGLEAQVISVTDKRDRYRALADRFADLSAPGETVTAVVVGQREQKQLTGIIRDALKDAGKLDRDGVTVEARTPVWLDSKTRRSPGSYRSGMVLEDRREAGNTKHWVIDRVHDETRILSVVDSDGVLSRMKLTEMTGDWRLFTRETIEVTKGEQLFALATDKSTGLKARDRLQVTDIAEGKLSVMRDSGTKSLTLDASQPLYITHGWVAAPGSRDNERGTVLASLNSRELSSNMMSALAQSGHRAEIFTGEVQAVAEGKIGRMRTGASPLELVRRASGKDETVSAVDSLRKGLLSDARLAVNRAVAQMQDVTFTTVELVKEASEFFSDLTALRAEVKRQVKEGDLLQAKDGSFVSRATWEMEKAIIQEVADGKGAVVPLMQEVDTALLSGLTTGQKVATKIVLGSPDRYTGIQGYAGVGKTTQFIAVRSALDSLPETQRPEITGLAPTHRAVKEMRDVGIESQTMKSFVLDWQQRTAAGEDIRFDNRLFLIDEASMLGNQDTAAAYRAITAGGGRAVIVGDVDQLKSPENGAPFRLQQERSAMDVAIMKEIVRQRSNELRSAVYSVIDNKAGAALQHIDRVSPLVVPREAGASVPEASVSQTAAPVAGIVSDFVSRTQDARARTMIITQLHDDRRAVNEGIHEALFNRGELGKESVTVPVLRRIVGGRHDFNSIKSWDSGQVVLANERYLNVIAVDSGNGKVLLRDEDGRNRYYSPAELNTSEIEVFERDSIEARAGDSMILSKTHKAAGHAAQEKYTVSRVQPDGTLTLQGRSGIKTLNPQEVMADRHVDYGWAVTGYGAQGASVDYVIALEGTEGGREKMSGMRAFYINTSRAKDHVQIYCDGLADWMTTLVQGDTGPQTAHDALAPENERRQARAVWAMGQPAGKTALGRAWLKLEGLERAATPVKVIPATRKYPQPHVAMPVYDGNGKAAGLALQPLHTDGGMVLAGEPRLLAAPGAEGAVVQRSRSGETLVAGTLREALQLAHDHPKDGVVWQTGEKVPGTQMLKMSGGKLQTNGASVRAAMDAVLDSLRLQVATLPEHEQDDAWQKLVAQVATELEKTEIRLPEEKPSLAERITVPDPVKNDISLPDDLLRNGKNAPVDLQAAVASLAGLQGGQEALRAVLAELAAEQTLPVMPESGATEYSSGIPASLRAKLADEKALQLQENNQRETERLQASREVDLAARVVSNRLAQDISLPASPTPGRELQREEMEPARTQHIQKER